MLAVQTPAIFGRSSWKKSLYQHLRRPFKKTANNRRLLRKPDMREASDTSPPHKHNSSSLVNKTPPEPPVPTTTVPLRPVSQRGTAQIEESKPPAAPSDLQIPLELNHDETTLPGSPATTSISQPTSAPPSPASSTEDPSVCTDCTWEGSSSLHRALSPPTSGPAAFVERRLSRKKQELLEELMVMLEECLEAKIQELEEARDAEGGPPGHGHGMPPGRRNGGGDGSAGRASRNNKRRLHGEGREGSSTQDGDGSEEDGVGGGRDAKRMKKQLNLACPYFKRDPERFQGKKHHSCVGGWDKYHRVKEHVSRHHAQPKYCSRCREPFKDAKTLEDHLRQEVPCPVVHRDVSHIDPIEGYTEEQRVKLQGRKTGNSERRKWEEMYCLLFNLDIETDIAQVPDPYCDDGNGHASFENKLETYLRRELPRVARPILAREIDDGVEGVKDNLQKKIPNIVSSILVALLSNVRSPQAFDTALGHQSSVILQPTTLPEGPASAPQIPPLGQNIYTPGLDDTDVWLSNFDPMNAGWDGWQAGSNSLTTGDYGSFAMMPGSPSDGTCSSYLTESRSSNTSPQSSPTRDPAEPAVSLNALQQIPIPPSQDKPLAAMDGAGVTEIDDWQAYLGYNGQI